MRKTLLVWSAGIFLTLFSSACNDDDPAPDLPGPGDVKELLYVINQGNLESMNTSLSVITGDSVVMNNVFREANNLGLGDCGQGCAVIGDYLCVTLNNSNKVEVMRRSDYRQVATILFRDERVPYYMVELNDTCAAVSDIAGTSLALIHTVRWQEIGSVEIGSESHQMVVSGKKLYVSTGRNIVVVSLDTFQKTGTIEVPVAGESRLIVDKAGYLWALAAGNAGSGKLVRIDVNNNRIVKIKTLEYPSGWQLGRWEGRLSINAGKDKLYFNCRINGITAIASVGIDDETIPEHPLFSCEGVRNFYCMAVSSDEHVYIADALDYVQRGWVYKFDLSGKKIGEFRVGIIPGDLLFCKQ